METSAQSIISEIQPWLIENAKITIPILLGFCSLLLIAIGWLVRRMLRNILASVKNTHEKLDGLQTQMQASDAALSKRMDKFDSQMNVARVQAVQLKDELKDDMHHVKDGVRDVDLKVTKNAMATERIQSDIKEAFHQIGEVQRLVSKNTSDIVDLNKTGGKKRKSGPMMGSVQPIKRKGGNGVEP